MGLVRMTKESIRRRLGYKAQAKKPLLQDQIDTLVSHFLSQPTIQGLANAFRVSLAYEASLRWDDYADMTLGDFIVTNDFVRVFLVETKTDSYKTGQWATFAASLRPTSAYQLYRRLVVALSDELNPEEIAQWPVMFKGDRGSFGQFSAINMPPTFLTLSVLENLRFFDPSKRDPKSNKTPTYNWPHFRYCRQYLGRMREGHALPMLTGAPNKVRGKTA